MPQGFCMVCWAVVPIVKQNTARFIFTAGASLLGIRARSLLGTLVAAGAGYLAGRLVDDAAAYVCGHCAGPIKHLA